MIIGNDSELIYINGANAVYDISDIPIDYNDMIEGNYYIIGTMVYKYIGLVEGTDEINPGDIGNYKGIKFIINTLSEDDDIFEERKIDSVIPREEYEKATSNIQSIMYQYVSNFKKDNNVAKGLEMKMKNTGDIYVPIIKDTDDVLTRMMKLMIRDKEVVLSAYKGKTDKDYSIDNLRSALNGTTLNMTISKYLSWCNILDLQWRFEIFDDPDLSPQKNPLGEKIVVAWDQDLNVDMGPMEPGIFRVDINEDDDPLKKLIKVAVWKKRMVLSEYKDKGSTPHLLNNMRSALKRKSKMMITYFVFWCEVLGITYNFTLYDPETGITHYGNKHYKATDYVEE